MLIIYVMGYNLHRSFYHSEKWGELASAELHAEMTK